MSSTVYLSSRIGSVPHFPRVSIWDFLFRQETGYANPIDTNADEDSVAYVDASSGEVLTRAVFRTKVKRLAYAFKHRLGLHKGDTVLICSSNSLHFPAVVLAVQAAGLVCSPANALFTPHELAYQVHDADARLVVAGCDQVAVVAAAGASNIFLMEPAPKCGSGSADPAYRSIWDLTDKEELEPEALTEEEAVNTIALLCYSSGTSGRPKGVKTTHYNITSALLQTMLSSPSSFTSREVWLATLPLSHMYAAFYHIYLAAHIGAKVVVLSKFSLDAFLDAIERHRVTSGHIVPPIAVRLSKDVLARAYDLSSLREWRSAAAPAGGQLVDILEERCGVTFHTLYAMTETTAVIAMTQQGERPPPGACGRLGPNVEAKIENGELCLKGPNITLGYHNKHDADVEAFDNEGFMRTGDLVKVDDEGYIYVLDRVKEVIKFNGYQVPPAELEDLLLKHPDIHDAAVIGIQDEARATEVPLACVVLRKPTQYHVKALELKRKEIVDFVAGQVAPFKQLRGGVRFLNQIPKSPAGKVLRRLLREEVRVARAVQAQKAAELKESEVQKLTAELVLAAVSEKERITQVEPQSTSPPPTWGSGCIVF
ncbi:hypothetical protein K488DRAFT_86858 [Vararia minispora EC-137]|uniref:Uncharacterized protein n=1 Tax=Vararia minispora EC-137 TaxID=1314806 RepID=A0ACB8QIF5_9AGAM|nr:hypothetical protein K488DRAFT_86858 [Vararia minispora EC-137]